MTELSTRDAAIIRLISRFKLVTSSHVNELLFSSTKSRTPADRALRRLTDQGFLHRVERRLVGGDRGGSGQYVYGLGRRGFYMHHTGRYTPIRSVQFHTLAITDLYVTLRRLEVAKQLAIVGLSTEPDCWVQLGGLELKPDLFVEFDRADGRHVRAFYEVDMGTEGQKQLRAKLDAVVRAWDVSGEYGWEAWPPTVWVCVDAERVIELRWLIGQLPEKVQSLFRVCELATLPATLGLSTP